MAQQNTFTIRELLQRYGQGNNTTNTTNYENAITQELQRLALLSQTNQANQTNQTLSLSSIDQELTDALAMRTRASAMAALANSGLQNARLRALVRAQQLRSEAERQLAIANSINPAHTTDLTDTIDSLDTTLGGFTNTVTTNTGTGTTSLDDILRMGAQTMQHRLAADRHEIAIRNLERAQTIQVLGGIYKNISGTVAGLSQLALEPYLQQIANDSSGNTNSTVILADLIALIKKIATAATTISTA